MSTPEDQSHKPIATSAQPGNPAEAQRESSQRPEDPEGPDDVMTRRVPGSDAADAAILAESHTHTRRSFVVAAAAAAAGYGFYHWLGRADPAEMQPTLLRDSFRANATLSRDVFHDQALSPTYPLNRAENLRVNGVIGLQRTLIPESYRLQLVGVKDAHTSPRFAADVTQWDYQYSAGKSGEDQGHDTKVDPKAAAAATPEKANTTVKMAPAQTLFQAMQSGPVSGKPKRGSAEAGESDSTLPAGTPGLLLTMDDLAPFPRHELVTQFKCIEGWSQIVHWRGIRMSDFMDAYAPAPVNGKTPRYVYMETPDGDYYTGYDIAVCRHPQTLLVTEMMGEPLTPNHGAPLRLHMPTKYGYKQIKRIALIAYTNTKPDDYWTRLGYDWYAGL